MCVTVMKCLQLCSMLRHKFFHRAKKVPVSEQELLARKKKKKEKDDKKEDKKEVEDAESSHAEGKPDDTKVSLSFWSGLLFSQPKFILLLYCLLVIIFVSLAKSYLFLLDLSPTLQRVILLIHLFFCQII